MVKRTLCRSDWVCGTLIKLKVGNESCEVAN
jgi:hypothetical protein